jgi:hypothetical protein
VRTKSSSITALAAALKRDPKSVRRDVLKLERAGVVPTRQQINPGHGPVKIVEPVAANTASLRFFNVASLERLPTRLRSPTGFGFGGACQDFSTPVLIDRLRNSPSECKKFLIIGMNLRKIGIHRYHPLKLLCRRTVVAR